MSKQTPILIKSFVADTAIANANVAVVMSTANPLNVMLPAAAGATKFIGVTKEPAASVYSAQAPNSLQVIIAGIAQIQSDGSAVVTAGDYIVIANATGQAKTGAALAFAGATVMEIIGMALNSVPATAGALIDFLIQPMLYKP